MITHYQMAHQPSVILMDHLVPNKLVHAVLYPVIVEVLQLIVNVPTGQLDTQKGTVPTALILEKVRLFEMSRKSSEKKIDK